MESVIDDVAAIIKRQDAEKIASLRAELAETRAKFDDYLLDYKAVHEIGAMRDLRTELAAARHSAYGAHVEADRLTAAARRDTQSIKNYITQTKNLQHKTRQDAEEIARLTADNEQRQLALECKNEEIARLTEALEFVVTFKITDSDGQEVCEDSLHEARKIARAALVRRPQSLSQSKADVCDACGGTWIFDDRDVARRPECCTGTFSCLACCPHGDKS